MGSEIYHTLGGLLKRKGLSSGVGDEGGYAPSLEGEEEALMLLCTAIKEAGYSTDTVKIALDAAASEWKKNGEKEYYLPKSGRRYTTEGLIDYWQELVRKYPILSIEAALGEEDMGGWRMLTERLPSTMLVGDDLFVTDEGRLLDGIEKGAGNAILIKPNQVGTLSETLHVIDMAEKNGYRYILSHRSGDTEDTTLADLAVGCGGGFIKAGAPCRSERVAKYNRLLKIEAVIFQGGIYG